LEEKMTISQQEVFINEMLADIEVVRSVLIAFVLGIAKSRPESFAVLKNGVLDGMAQLGVDAPRRQDNERVRQLTLARAQAFFADVEKGLGLLQTKLGASEVNL
jgi:hypothetical protein